MFRNYLAVLNYSYFVSEGQIRYFPSDSDLGKCSTTDKHE